MFLFMPIAFLFGQRTLSAQFHTKNAIKCDAFITSILSYMNIYVNTYREYSFSEWEPN